MLEFRNVIGELITFLTWLAPSQNTDGSEIAYDLAYQLYIGGAPVMTFPGTLNADGRYRFPLADVPALASPGTYEVTLTAYPQGIDLELEPGRESAPSNAIILEVIEVIIPKAPSDLSTE